MNSAALKYTAPVFPFGPTYILPYRSLLMMHYSTRAAMDCIPGNSPAAKLQFALRHGRRAFRIVQLICAVALLLWGIFHVDQVHRYLIYFNTVSCVLAAAPYLAAHDRPSVQLVVALTDMSFVISMVIAVTQLAAQQDNLPYFAMQIAAGLLSCASLAVLM